MTTVLRRIGILSPGEMGQAIGGSLQAHGLEVATCLTGRSERTRQLAQQAGLVDLPNLAALVDRVDLILSIAPPAKAMDVARAVADALRSAGRAVYFADCNAVAPQTALAIGEEISAAGGRYIDASIIGLPPGPDSRPRIYASGPHAPAMAALDGMGLEIVNLGGTLGRASAIKMCYAALTKGTFALYFAAALAAEQLGLAGELFEELAHSQAAALGQMRRQLPLLPAKSGRWVGEMEQIAMTLRDAGLPGEFHEAAAAIYRHISNSPLGAETPETINRHRTLEETIVVLARSLPPGRSSGA